MKQNTVLNKIFILASFFLFLPVINYAEDIPIFTDADLEKYRREADSRVEHTDEIQSERTAPALGAPMSPQELLNIYENNTGGSGPAMPTGAYDHSIKVKPPVTLPVKRTPPSALRTALWKKQEEIALQLIKNGAFIDEKSFDQNNTANPLLVIALRGNMFKAAKALIERGADVNGIEFGVPLISYFIAYDTADDSILGKVRFLCDHGADIERRPVSRGSTPLMIAAEQGNYHVVKLLLSHGADINARYTNPPGYGSSDEGSTALGFAAHAGHASVVELLLTKGTDITLKKTNGYTPLIDSLLLGHQEVAKILIDGRADVNAETIDYITPLGAALRKKDYKVAQLLVDKGADVNAKKMKGYVYSLMDHGDIETAKFIVKNGFNMNDSYEGTTPLYYAALHGLDSYVQLFVNNHANVNGRTQLDRTPLMAASENGHITTVKLLLAKGADLDAVDSSGLTAFFLAKQKGHAYVAEYLRSHGADTAAYSKQSELISVMREKGFISPDANPEEITPQNLEYFQLQLKEIGIEDVRTWKPNPEYSTPERTWAHYQQALSGGDFDAAQQCHIPGVKLIDVYKQMGKEVTREIVSNMRPLQKISGDGKRATYRLLRQEDGRDISYMVNFSNMFGEWKIERY